MAVGVLLRMTTGRMTVVLYAQRFPNAQVEGVENDPASVKLADKNIAEAGLSDRVEVQQADATQLSAENLCDLVTLNVVLHETGGPTEYCGVLSRVRTALKPGGTVVVSELPYPDSPSEYRDEPAHKALAAVQLHEAIAGCGMITKGELRELLVSTGFSNARVAAQPMPSRFVMLGEKCVPRTRQ